MKMTQGLFLLSAALLLMAPGATVRADFAMDDIRNQALQAAADKAQAELAGLQVARDKTIGVLPMGGDTEDRAMERRLMSALTHAGFKVVEARNDPLWDEIMREVEWGDRKHDIVDEQTLVKFGQLQGIQTVLYGNVLEMRRPGRMVFVEIELHLSSLETRRHLWGGRFAERRYAADELRGPVNLDPLVRRALQAAVSDALRTMATAPALGEGLSAAILPLSGDLDGYATHLLTDALSASGAVRPRQLDLRTLGEARALLRDQPATADAVLVGAVRDLTPRHLRHDEIYKRQFQAEAEVQFSLQDAATGDILWSGTGSGLAEEEERDPPVSLIRRLLRDYPRVFIGIGIFLVVAFVWGVLKRTMTRVR